MIHIYFSRASQVSLTKGQYLSFIKINSQKVISLIVTEGTGINLTSVPFAANVSEIFIMCLYIVLPTCIYYPSFLG